MGHMLCKKLLVNKYHPYVLLLTEPIAEIHTQNSQNVLKKLSSDHTIQ